MNENKYTRTKEEDIHGMISYVRRVFIHQDK
jgi:hypothetical protein